MEKTIQKPFQIILQYLSFIETVSSNKISDIEIT